MSLSSSVVLLPRARVGFRRGIELPRRERPPEPSLVRVDLAHGKAPSVSQPPRRFVPELDIRALAVVVKIRVQAVLDCQAELAHLGRGGEVG